VLHICARSLPSIATLASANKPMVRQSATDRAQTWWNAAAVVLAEIGDRLVARSPVRRLAPATKSRPVQVDLPAIEKADDVLKAQGATIEAMASGQITPDEAATIAGVLDAKRKAIETVQLEERVAKLEQQTGAKR
jgi:hypothetical protein